METRYIPEIVLKQRICKICGGSVFEFTEIEEPYLCFMCDKRDT